MASLAIAHRAEVTSRKSPTTRSRWHGFRGVVRRECGVPPLEIGLQAIQLSPYRTDLAGPYLQRLPVFPAFPTGCFPLRFSPSGRSDDPEVFLRTSHDCVTDSAPRPAAHRFPPSGSSADTTRGYTPHICTVIRGRGRGKSFSRSLNLFQ